MLLRHQVNGLLVEYVRGHTCHERLLLLLWISLCALIKLAEPEIAAQVSVSFFSYLFSSSYASCVQVWYFNVVCMILAGCRYEFEEDPGVCRALEHAAEYFISHSQIEELPGPGMIGHKTSTMSQTTESEHTAQ